jgi:hypothetical protein
MKRLAWEFLEINDAYNKAVADLGIFDRSFFAEAIGNDKLFAALSPELQKRARTVRNLLRRPAEASASAKIKRLVRGLWESGLG